MVVDEETLVISITGIAQNNISSLLASYGFNQPAIDEVCILIIVLPMIGLGVECHGSTQT